MEYTRRYFIKTGLAGLGCLALNQNLFSKAYPAESLSTRFYDPYERINLGKTNIQVTRLGMGTGIVGGGGESNLTRLGFESGVELVQAIYEGGVRLFDCADTYGSHFIVGEALKEKKRSDYAIFSKIWAHGGNKPNVKETLELFLKELQTDYLDGFLLHCMMSENWNTEYSELMEEMDKLKQRGLIRSHGISCHSLDALRTAVKESWVDTCHVRINPFNVNMDEKTEEVLPIIQELHQEEKGIIGMKIYGEGKFASDPDKKNESLAFALQSGVIDVLNLGMDKISDLLDTEERIKALRR